MNLASLKPTLRNALLDLVGHGELHREPGGYVPSSPGTHAPHTMRAMLGLVRAGLAVWIDDQNHLRPTAVGRTLVREAAAAANGGRIERSLAA